MQTCRLCNLKLAPVDFSLKFEKVKSSSKKKKKKKIAGFDTNELIYVLRDRN